MSGVEFEGAGRVPQVCRREAFDLLESQLGVLETTSGLLHAAVAIALHAMEDAHPRFVEKRIGELADRVRQRLRSHATDAILAHLHDVLFEEEGFAGDIHSYYDPANSYLPAVLESRRGIPITLSLVYKLVAEQVGLRVDGINAPGHFLVLVSGPDETMLVDPFFGGKALTREEAFQRVESVTGRTFSRDRRFLECATHRQWVARMLGNLQHIFATSGRAAELAAMTELQSLLGDFDGTA